MEGQTDTAIKRMEERSKTAPDDLNARFLLAQLYDMSHQYASAIDAYEKILQKVPDNWAGAE